MSQLRKANDRKGSVGEYKPIMLSVARPAGRPEVSSTEGEETPYSDGDTSDAGMAFGAGASASHQAQTDNGPEDLDTIARQAGLDDAAVSFLASDEYFRFLTGNRCANSTVVVERGMDR